MAVGAPGPARIHRFPAAAPVRDVAAPQADAMVELIALDIARALEIDPADGAGRTRRRVARMGDTTRAAVVARVNELLGPTQREQAAAALTGAALGPEPDAEATVDDTAAPADAGGGAAGGGITALGLPDAARIAAGAVGRMAAAIAGAAGGAMGAVGVAVGGAVASIASRRPAGLADAGVTTAAGGTASGGTAGTAAGAASRGAETAAAAGVVSAAGGPAQAEDGAAAEASSGRGVARPTPRPQAEQRLVGPNRMPAARPEARLPAHPVPQPQVVRRQAVRRQAVRQEPRVPRQRAPAVPRPQALRRQAGRHSPREPRQEAPQARPVTPVGGWRRRPRPVGVPLRVAAPWPKPYRTSGRSTAWRRSSPSGSGSKRRSRARPRPSRRRPVLRRPP